MIQPGEFNVNPSFRSAPTVSHLTLCMRLPKPGVSKMSLPSSLLYFCDFKLGMLWGGFTVLLICKSSQDQCLLCLVRVPWRKTSISIVFELSSPCLSHLTCPSWPLFPPCILLPFLPHLWGYNQTSTPTLQGTPEACLVQVVLNVPSSECPMFYLIFLKIHNKSQTPSAFGVISLRKMCS